MVIPNMDARVEQRYELAVYQRGDVGSFEKVAPVARKAEVHFVVGATMLFCDGMFDMKRGKRQIVLMAMAILAPIAGTAPDESTESGVNCHCWRRVDWPPRPVALWPGVPQRN